MSRLQSHFLTEGLFLVTLVTLISELMDVFCRADVHQQPEQSNYLAEGQILNLLTFPTGRKKRKEKKGLRLQGIPCLRELRKKFASGASTRQTSTIKRGRGHKWGSGGF